MVSLGFNCSSIQQLSCGGYAYTVKVDIPSTIAELCGDPEQTCHIRRVARSGRLFTAIYTRKTKHQDARPGHISTRTGSRSSNSRHFSFPHQSLDPLEPCETSNQMGEGKKPTLHCPSQHSVRKHHEARVPVPVSGVHSTNAFGIAALFLSGREKEIIVHAGVDSNRGRKGEALVCVGLVDNVFHGLVDAVDGVGVLVRDLDAELLLDGHDHLDGVEAVEAEVVGEMCC